MDSKTVKLNFLTLGDLENEPISKKVECSFNIALPLRASNAAMRRGLESVVRKLRKSGGSGQLRWRGLRSQGLLFQPFNTEQVSLKHTLCVQLLSDICYFTATCLYVHTQIHTHTYARKYTFALAFFLNAKSY